jgi:hypothetical protein
MYLPHAPPAVPDGAILSKLPKSQLPTSSLYAAQLATKVISSTYTMCAVDLNHASREDEASQRPMLLFMVLYNWNQRCTVCLYEQLVQQEWYQVLPGEDHEASPGTPFSTRQTLRHFERLTSSARTSEGSCSMAV